MLPESSSFVMLGLQVWWVFSGHGSADLRPLGWAQAVENLAEQSLDFLSAARAIGRVLALGKRQIWLVRPPCWSCLMRWSGGGRDEAK